NLAGRYLSGDNFRTISLKREEFQPLLSRPREYGRKLSEALFGDPDLKQFFVDACTSSRDLGGLHLRLRFVRKLLGPHGLRWEPWHAPRDGTAEWPLTTNQNVLFSRYVALTADRPPRSRRPGQRLRAVVALAAPDDITAYPREGRREALAPVRVAEERQRAEAALEGCELDFLAGPGEAGLGNLASHASAGRDIPHLACHGSLAGAEPRLYLVSGEGAHPNRTKPADGRELVERLKEWYDQPFVVVLASCESGGKEWDDAAHLDEYGALAALG